MATYRIGIGSEFQLKDQAAGIGNSTTGLGNLIVEGTVKASNLNPIVSGVTTFIRYSGFVDKELSGDSVTLTGEHSTNSDIVVGTGKTFIVSVGATVDVGTVGSVSIGTHFSPPIGGVEDRPDAVHEGMVRYNTDVNTLEFYNGREWKQFVISGASGRGIFAAGNLTGNVTQKTIEEIKINSFGNSTDFGELAEVNYGGAATSNSSRGVIWGGWQAGGSPGNNFDIEYFNMQSRGVGIDWGQNSSSGWGGQGTSSSIRGISAGGGYPNGINVIETIYFANKGRIDDWGDLSSSNRGRGSTGLNSQIRSVFFGGYGNYTDYMEFKNTASMGNTTDFGKLTSKSRLNAGASSPTRGVIFGGEKGNGTTTDTIVDEIQYVTIASEGNAREFGDLSTPTRNSAAVSTHTRAVSAGGYNAPIYVNHIEYVTIATLGNSRDFGDLSRLISAAHGCSDSHGGIGGY